MEIQEKTKEIDLDNLMSLKRYHQELFDDFINFKDYSKLEEYIMFFDILEDYRIWIKNDPRSYIYLESYILDLKSTAYKFYELAEQYDYNEFSIIDDYIDKALKL
jgi:hypothetical protein